MPGVTVEVFYTSGGTSIGSDKAYFRTVIAGVPPGYDITNTSYPGWCADTANQINPSNIYGACCFHDTSPPFPPGLVAKYPAIVTVSWDKINYILNHRPEYYQIWGQDSNIIQTAIWNITNGVPVSTPTGGITLNATEQTWALQIVAAANANGTGYTPPCGGVKGILVNVSAVDPIRQLTMVEVPVDCNVYAFGNMHEPGNLSGYKLDPSNTGCPAG